jgi:hypothetical protein
LIVGGQILIISVVDLHCLGFVVYRSRKSKHMNVMEWPEKSDDDDMTSRRSERRGRRLRFPATRVDSFGVEVARDKAEPPG